MPNNEMDYSLIHRTPDGNGKILVTTPGSPDKGSWETEAELKTYVNQDVVKKTDIVQSLGQQTDKVPSNKAVDDAINAISNSLTGTEFYLTGDSTQPFTMLLDPEKTYMIINADGDIGVAFISNVMYGWKKKMIVSNNFLKIEMISISDNVLSVSKDSSWPSGYGSAYRISAINL